MCISIDISRRNKEFCSLQAITRQPKKKLEKKTTSKVTRQKQTTYPTREDNHTPEQALSVNDHYMAMKAQVLRHTAQPHLARAWTPRRGHGQECKGREG